MHAKYGFPRSTAQMIRSEKKKKEGFSEINNSGFFVFRFSPSGGVVVLPRPDECPRRAVT